MISAPGRRGRFFGPDGWIAGLDYDGRESPVSQIPPIGASNYLLIDNANTEPVPNWVAATRIVNHIPVHLSPPLRAHGGPGCAGQDRGQAGTA